ncbi:hypothetical protein ACW5UC_24155 [Priestia aryabhattai]|uniref:hypothetical protein n=1 Tax=Priestia megaterium TaxID=1404 RepID=UPI003F94ACC6
MKPLNPIFDKQIRNESKVNNSHNIRKKPVTKAEGRKERCDKKKDVKVPFSLSERQLIKQLAKNKGTDPTPYCTQLIKKAMKEKYIFPEVIYDPKGKPYPVKLEGYFHDQLFEYKILWDCSLKEAAYRILSFMLHMEVRNRL